VDHPERAVRRRGARALGRSARAGHPQHLRRWPCGSQSATSPCCRLGRPQGRQPKASVGIALHNAAVWPASESEADIAATELAHAWHNFPLFLEPLVYGRYPVSWSTVCGPTCRAVTRRTWRRSSCRRTLPGSTTTPATGSATTPPSGRASPRPKSPGCPGPRWIG